MSSNKSDIYSILADTLRKVREARHPLSKIVRSLLLNRGINKISWDKMVAEHISTDPSIVAKKHGNPDKSQERNRINKHISDPDSMTFRTVRKFAQITKASKMVIRVELIWEDPDTGDLIDSVSASATEIINVK